ncbi:MAG: hypothetical protein ACI9FU_000753 [Granulosicoccus sp.]|jgi:hypothetical protein
MISNLRYIFVLSAFLILSAFRSEPAAEKASVERLEYEIIVLNKSVGEFVAERSDLNNTADYSITSNISVWLFKHFTFTYELSARYENDVLVNAKLCNRLNDDLKAKSSDNFDGAQYHTNTKDGSVIDYNHAEVDYSAANLFFEEPGDRTSLFSENYGVDLAIEKVGAHRYKLTLPNGDYNFYDYEEGQVSNVEMHRKLAVVKLLVKQS